MNKNYIVFSDELRASEEALVADKMKGRVISRDKLSEYINYQVDSLYGVRNWITRIDPNIRKKLVNTVATISKQDASGLGAYSEFKKLLIPSALKDANKLMLEEIVNTLGTYADAADFLESKVPELFPEKNISMMNMKPKTLALLGIIDTLDRLSSFSELLMYTVVTVVVDKKNTSKLIQKKLAMDYEIVATLVNNIYAKDTNLNLADLIVNIGEVAGPSNIVDSSMKVNYAAFGKTKLSGFEAKIAKHAISNFSNIFLPLWEAINMFRHTLEKRRAENIEWMRAQVELLNRKMEGLDESSSEYKRLKKIVDKYNDIIEKRMRKEEKRHG